MKYTINRMFHDSTLNDINVRTRFALADTGFGMVPETDVKATMKKKLDIEMRPYLIRDAYNLKVAHEAIGIAARTGAMLPCNVSLREVDGGVQVSANVPVAAMQAIENARLLAFAGQMRGLLAKAVAAI